MNTKIVLFLLFLLSFWGCQPREKKIVIGFSQCMTNDLWRQTMIQDMKMAASLYPNVELIIKDAGENSQRQIEQIRELSSLNVDLLIISPNESQPITSPAVEAYQRGIPTIIVDRKIESDLYTAYIGADNFEIGKSVGVYIGNVFKGKGKILEIRGLDGSSPAEERHKGFLEALTRFPDMKVVSSFDGKWQHETAMKMAIPAFRENNYNIVFGHNDVMAYGARRAADTLGLDSIFIVGIDALPQLGFSWVEQGKLQASFIYPTGGVKAIETALDILAKRPFSRVNYLNTSVVDISNAKVLKLQQEQVVSYQQVMEKQMARISDQMIKYDNQRTILNIILISFFLLIGFAAALFYSYYITNKKNHELEQKNNAIRQQKELLESQNIQILEMNQKVEAATQAKLRFFTNISHEIRTPLTLINAPLQNVMSRLPETYGYLHSELRMIQRNSERLLRLINQLMDFRKLEWGMTDLVVTESDVVLLVTEIYKAFQPLANQKNITFGFTTDQKKEMMWFDLDKIDKVIFNVLSNAFKFTPDDGRISIHVVTKQSDFTEIRVSDSGPGITFGKENQIFERFFQQREHRHQGTGIGLSLSKEFMDLHHGEIIASNLPAGGSCFIIRLRKGKAHFLPEELSLQTVEDYKISAPILEETVLSDHQLPEQEKKNHAAKTDLIVEDDPDLQSYLKSCLAEDYVLLQAVDGI